MLKKRIITAAVLLLLVGLCLFYFPPIVWVVFCSVLLSCALYEWTRFAGYSKFAQYFYIVFTFCISCFLLFWQSRSAVIIVFYYIAAFFWCCIAPLWLKYQWRLANHPWRAAICGWVILVPAFDVLYHARLSFFITQKLLLIVIIVWIADSAAYFVGRAWGKHKLAFFISPGKSWEGVVGALLVVGIYAFGVAYFIWELNQVLLISSVVIISWVLTAISIVGDLLESLFKRQLGIKDSSCILPGHGGVLDRLDSLLALLPFAGILLIWS